MSRKPIPVEEIAKSWFEDPEFVGEYDALEEEFTLAAASIQIRSAVDVKREEPTEGRES